MLGDKTHMMNTGYIQNMMWTEFQLILHKKIIMLKILK